MGIIRVDSLCKEFHRPRRYEGFLGGVRSLVTRQYDVTRAVDGVSFDVEAGELVGYLGPNGAGKSTTIKMMTGILVPTSGSVEVAGLVPWRNRKRNARNIGVVFGQRTQLWWDLPLADSFELVRAMYQVPQALYRRNMDRFTDLLGLHEFMDRPVRQLSLGQRMRGDLAAAMLYEPPILFLDEPTIGLDVMAKEAMREFIEEMNRETGTTIVLTTHDLADVERLANRIILIDHGSVLYDGDVATLKDTYAPHRVLVVQMAPELADAGQSLLIDPADVPGAEITQQVDGKAWIRFEGKQTAVSQLIAGLTAKYPVADLSIVEPDLEGVVRRIYAGRVPVR